MEIPKPTETELHRIAITGVIWKMEKDGTRRYLITKRSPQKKVWPNLWTVPGGGMLVSDYLTKEGTYINDAYHPAELTLKREIKEEVGVEIEDEHFLHDVAFIRPDGIPVLVLTFYCKYMSGEIVLDEDATEFAWIKASEASKYNFIKGIGQEIQTVEKKLSGS